MIKGQEYRAKREALKLTREQLAVLAECSRAAIEKLEGDRGAGKFLLQRIDEALEGERRRQAPAVAEPVALAESGPMPYAQQIKGQNHTAASLQRLRLRILHRLAESPPGPEQQQLLSELNAIALVQGAMAKYPPSEADEIEAHMLFEAAKEAAPQSPTKYPRPRGGAGKTSRPPGSATKG